MTTAQTPDERAAAAAAALAADGDQVTARAVQQAARVNMSVAARAAREWNEGQAQTRDVPEPPDAVTVRFQGVWREAIEAARAEHQAEREGWTARITSIEDERDAALEDINRVQGELDQAIVRIVELEAAIEQARADTASANERIAAAETRATAAESLTAGLREALAAISPAPAKKR